MSYSLTADADIRIPTQHLDNRLIYRVAEGWYYNTASLNATSNIISHRFDRCITYDTDKFNVQVDGDGYQYLICKHSARYIFLVTCHFTNTSNGGSAYSSAIGISDGSGNGTWAWERCDEFATILSGLHSAFFHPYVTSGEKIKWACASSITRRIESVFMTVLYIG